MANKKHIAVFGDTHGHLRLMFQLCRLWQLEHGVHLDGILQCGDLGFFPNLGNLDKATKRFANRDPEELGFAFYFAQPQPPEKDPLLARTLTGPASDLNTVRCAVTWCHGNHEDFQALEQLVGSDEFAPVDAWEKLWLLQAGCIAEVAGLKVAAVGGGPEPGSDGPQGSDTKNSWQWVSARACHRLVGQKCDVLISHCAPHGIDLQITDWDWGSQRLRSVLDFCQPAYHFYAHHAMTIPPGRIGDTQCFWLNDVNFKRAGKKKSGMAPFLELEPGCMGILTWHGPEDHTFEAINEKWMNEITWSNWRDL